ncbi:MAG TPA: zinc-binding dehydrogenase [Planctomycetota bacterium]|nr:zinc-binding dehydrogenase [Planctomycetota bacterium]
MESVVVTRFGGPEVLEVRSGPSPTPKPGEVLVRVRAVGLNFADIFAREGLYGPGPRAPFVPGFEVAGETPDGRRVIAVTRFGGYASEVVVEERRTYPLPDGWSFEEGAGFPAVALTAWHGIVNVARMRAGERLLVHSAAGGVGIAAGQIARALGIEAWGTVGSDEKLDVAREAGYAKVVNYRKSDFETELGSVDVVLDAIGGSFFEKGYRMLRPNGRLLCYGLAGMTPRGRRPSWPRLAWEWLRLPRWNPIQLIDDNKTVAGFQVLRLWDEVAVLDAAMKDLLALAGRGALRPRIGARFPFARAAEAMQLLHSGTTTGKVVLVT